MQLLGHFLFEGGLVLKGRRYGWSVILGVAVMAWACAWVSAPALAAAAEGSASEDIFAMGYAGTLRIEISGAGLASLRQSPRGYVRATVREGAIRYTNVAVHLKGSAGSFRPIDDRPSLTLHFSKFAEGQTFHGYKKIHLNSSIQDRTFLNERISRELFNAAGVPMPRSAHATVELNGRKLGLHVLVEGFNKQFLKRHFDQPDGNLYEGGRGRDVGVRLTVNEGEDRANHTGMRALLAALRESDRAVRRAKLERTLDMDRFLSFMAMEVMLAHWDGYTIGVNNFRVFHDLGSGKMVFLPHGTDQVLGDRVADLTPEAKGEVARVVLEDPELRRRYTERMKQLVTNVFVTARITGLVRETAARIKPLQVSSGEGEGGSAAQFEQRVNAVCRRVARREEFLRRELFKEYVTLVFDGAGAARLKNWRPAAAATPVDLENRSELSPAELRIRLLEPGSGSWRSEVNLLPGKYRFGGRLKLDGVEVGAGDDRGGVSLRISGKTASSRLKGSTEWREMSFDFEVADRKVPVEFVCELRGIRGEVRFDVESMRVTKR